MTQEESIILSYLQSAPESSFNRRQIARRAVKRSFFEENPHWADQPLAALVGRGMVIIDKNGLYQFKRAN